MPTPRSTSAPTRPPPEAYSTSPVCPVCGQETQLLRAVSFVDAPGHESLMTNMLAGAALMDGAILVIAAQRARPDAPDAGSTCSPCRCWG